MRADVQGMLCRVLSQEKSLLPHVLSVFLGSHGIGHTDEVRSHECAVPGDKCLPCARGVGRILV